MLLENAICAGFQIPTKSNTAEFLNTFKFYSPRCGSEKENAQWDSFFWCLLDFRPSERGFIITFQSPSLAFRAPALAELLSRAPFMWKSSAQGCCPGEQFALQSVCLTQSPAPAVSCPGSLSCWLPTDTSPSWPLSGASLRPAPSPSPSFPRPLDLQLNFFSCLTDRF